MIKTLEIIAHNINDIKKINQSIANRIELCVDMPNDGLTPSLELVKKSLDLTTIPIMVMIRNHYRNFVYNETQFQEMLSQIIEYQKLPIKGIVVGCLTDNQEINFPQMQAIKNVAGDLEITFHRAFDQVIDKVNSAKKLAEIGIKRVMTIGNPKQPIINNVNLLLKLAQNIEILAGGGISEDNIFLLEQAGLSNFHLGTAIRKNKSWDQEIIISKINQLKI